MTPRMELYQIDFENVSYLFPAAANEPAPQHQDMTMEGKPGVFRFIYTGTQVRQKYLRHKYTFHAHIPPKSPSTRFNLFK